MGAGGGCWESSTYQLRSRERPSTGEKKEGKRNRHRGSSMVNSASLTTLNYRPFLSPPIFHLHLFSSPFPTSFLSLLTLPHTSSSSLFHSTLTCFPERDVKQSLLRDWQRDFFILLSIMYFLRFQSTNVGCISEEVCPPGVSVHWSSSDHNLYRKILWPFERMWLYILECIRWRKLHDILNMQPSRCISTHDCDHWNISVSHL